MIDSLVNLAVHLADAAAHVDYASALALVALAALGVAALGAPFSLSSWSSLRF